jgi:hypothetical protein
VPPNGGRDEAPPDKLLLHLHRTAARAEAVPAGPTASFMRLLDSTARLRRDQTDLVPRAGDVSKIIEHIAAVIEANFLDRGAMSGKRELALGQWVMQAPGAEELLELREFDHLDCGADGVLLGIQVHYAYLGWVAMCCLTDSRINCRARQPTPTRRTPELRCRR